MLDAATESLQPGEPLLRHPLEATDVARSFEGMRLPPIRSSDLPRCSSIPTGVLMPVVGEIDRITASS